MREQKSPQLLVPLSRIFLGALAIGVMWLGYSYFAFKADDIGGYGSITGILVSAKEHVTEGRGRSGYLEIRLQDDPIRYCVPADGYLDSFRREAFFSEVPQGASVELAARSTEIAKPRTFLFNDTPTVFVRGVRCGGRDYCTVRDQIAWQERNNRWKGVVLAASLVGGFFMVWSKRRPLT